MSTDGRHRRWNRESCVQRRFWRRGGPIEHRLGNGGKTAHRAEAVDVVPFRRGSMAHSSAGRSRTSRVARQSLHA